MVDLIHLYWIYDKNRNGKIEQNELEEDVKPYDLNGDGALSPWEVMEAVNKARNWQIFSPQAIAKMKKENETGRSTIPYYPQSEEVCRNILKQIDREGALSEPAKGLLYRSIIEDSGYLACDTTIDGVKLKIWSSVDIARFQYRDDPGKRVTIALAANDRKEINGISYKLELFFIIYANNIAKFQGGILAEDVELSTFNQLVKFKKGTFLRFWNYGQNEVRFGTLAEDKSLSVGKRKIKFKAGENIFYHPNGKVMSGVTAEAAEMNSHLWEANTMLVFDKKGDLTEATPFINKMIGKYKFKAKERICFNSKGKIVAGTLVNDLKLMGTAPSGHKFEIILSGGELINFYDFEKGIIASGKLAENAVIGPFTFKKGTSLASYNSRDDKDRISNGTLARDAVIRIKGDRIKLEADTEIKFYENGNIKEAVIAESGMIDGKWFKAGTELRFFDNGRISWGILAKDTEIKIGNHRIIKFKQETKMGFYSDGSVYSGVLAEDNYISGKIRLAGTRIELSPEGKIIKEVEE